MFGFNEEMGVFDDIRRTWPVNRLESYTAKGLGSQLPATN